MARVLLVGKGAPERGGIPAFLETLLTPGAVPGHQLDLLNLAHGGTPEGGRASLRNARRTLSDVQRVWRSAEGRDVVHIHSALAPGVTLLRAGLLAAAARARGRPVVVHAHGGLVQLWLTDRWRRALVRVALRPAAHVAAVSSEGARVLREVLGDRVSLVDNGVDVEVFAAAEPEPHEVPRVLYVGLLTPRKGVLDLFEASRLLQQRQIGHELWLVGGTPDEGPAAERTVRDAAPSTVRFLGTRAHAEMPAVYRGADVFCLPSWWEAMPLSVLEAMASGTAVVATDVGDVRRVVQDGRTGLLVAPRAPTELAAALERLLCDAETRRRVSAAGRGLVVREFSSRATTRAVARIYDDVGRRPG